MDVVAFCKVYPLRISVDFLTFCTPNSLRISSHFLTFARGTPKDFSGCKGYLLGFHGCPYMLQGVPLRFSVSILQILQGVPLGVSVEFFTVCKGYRIPLGFHWVSSHFAMGVLGLQWNSSHFARDTHQVFIVITHLLQGAPLRISMDFPTFAKGTPPPTLPLPIRISVDVLTFYKGTS